MSNQPSKKRPSKDYLKYSGLAFQFLAAIIIGLLIGKWLDGQFKLDRPIFTIIFSLLFIIASLVLVIRDITKKE